MGSSVASFVIKRLLVLSLILCVGTSACSDCPSEIVRHIVFNRFYEHITQGEIDEIVAAYANLVNIIPELKDFKWGKDLGPGVEDRANGFTHSYETTFHSVEDFVNFFSDPRTKTFGKKFWPATEKFAVLNYIVNTSFPYQWALPYKWSPDHQQPVLPSY